MKPNKKSNGKSSNGKVTDILRKSKMPILSPIVALPKVIANGVEQITMSSEEAGKIRVFEQNALQAKVQLAELDLQIMDLQNKKNQLVEFIRTQSQEMVKEVRGIAQAYGIDVDGVTDSRRWNLNTTDMTFHLVKS